MFNNITSHAIYAKNGLPVIYMNNSSGSHQHYLRASWYEIISREIIL